MLKNKLLSAMGGAPANYIEDVFSTWLYTGNGSTQTITNGIDLAGKGGLVWMKNRTNVQLHSLCDTVTGAGKYLNSASTAAQSSGSTFLQSFNSTGFGIGSTFNATGDAYASWTFRDQAKFFDVVTWTGNGANRTIAHNLGSAPGCMIVKRTDSTGNWYVWHRSFTTAGSTDYIFLNDSSEKAIGGALPLWNNTVPTASVFSLSDRPEVNSNGATYVAYLFAHNAGGFGLSGTDNVISCGSYFGLGATDVNLGWEPQFLLVKPIDLCGTAGDWFVIDNMRGMRGVGTSFPRERFLNPNATYPESIDSGGTNPYGNNDSLNITATGFRAIGYPFTGVISGGYRTYIYIAIRRGPMKVPTTGTSVFNPVTDTGTATAKSISAGFVVDAGIRINRDHLTWAPNTMYDRLQGAAVYMNTNATSANIDFTPFFTSFDQSGITLTNSGFNGSGATYVNYFFRRAPGYFDEVCWSGDGTGNARNHNLTVYPELVISKLSSGGAGFGAWNVQNNINPSAKQTGVLNTTAAFSSSGATSPTATVFYPTDDQSGATYVTYLFASCPGVSKVGSYTGNGSNQTINCGFTGGARFVMIKRTDSTGDWYVWDTARGIVSGNDPRLSLNTTAAEVTTDDSVDTDSTGFVVNQLSATNINVNAATYIYLAIA